MLNYPRVPAHVLEVDALRGVLLQELHDQVTCKGCDEVWELDVNISDSTACGTL